MDSQVQVEANKTAWAALVVHEENLDVEFKVKWQKETETAQKEQCKMSTAEGPGHCMKWLSSKAHEHFHTHELFWAPKTSSPVWNNNWKILYIWTVRLKKSHIHRSMDQVGHSSRPVEFFRLLLQFHHIILFLIHQKSWKQQWKVDLRTRRSRYWSGGARTRGCWRW